MNPCCTSREVTKCLFWVCTLTLRTYGYSSASFSGRMCGFRICHGELGVEQFPTESCVFFVTEALPLQFCKRYQEITTSICHVSLRSPGFRFRLRDIAWKVGVLVGRCSRIARWDVKQKGRSQKSSSTIFFGPPKTEVFRKFMEIPSSPGH